MNEAPCKLGDWVEINGARMRVTMIDRENRLAGLVSEDAYEAERYQPEIIESWSLWGNAKYPAEKQS